MEYVKINGKLVPLGEDRLDSGCPYPYLCPVCGEFAFVEDGNYDVCPMCGWENEKFQNHYPDEGGSPNHVSLNQAKSNYKKFGAIRQEDVELVKAMRERLSDGEVPHNGTMYKHIREFFKEADPVKALKGK